MNENVNTNAEHFKCSGLCMCNNNACFYVTTALENMALPLYERLDMFLDISVRMLELMEARGDTANNLNEQLMDALELKELLKVGDTKFASMKKLFRTYEVDKKPYYLKQEVLEIIRHHEVFTNTGITDA